VRVWNVKVFAEIVMNKRFLEMVLLLGALVASNSFACSSCGCTLNSDWSSQGYVAGKGVSIDLRYDYFDQTELRTGAHSVDRSAIGFPTDREIQQTTTNKNTTLGVDYGISRYWGVGVQLPYFDRLHTTITEGDTDISTSHTRSVGDVRVMARYQGFSEDVSYGVQFGLKLPTGRIDALFSDGPQVGESLDRGLQPGTGTTDLLIGAYNVGSLAPAFSYFAQVLLQQALTSRDGFKPGIGLNANIGARYTGFGKIVPQLQLNLRVEDRESGSNADIPNSGATLAFISPGVSFKVASRADIFAYAQLPLYQRVNGLQLEARYFFSAGFHFRY